MNILDRLAKKSEGNCLDGGIEEAERLTTTDLLTPDEQEAMRLSGELASLCHRIIGNGPQAANDWSEMAVRIHGVQHMILAQAAARAYPDEYRLLGGTLNPARRAARTA